MKGMLGATDTAATRRAFLRGTALAAGAAATRFAPAVGAQRDGSEANKALVRDAIGAIWNEGKVDAADEFYSPAYGHYDPDRHDIDDLASFKQYVTETRTTFEGYQVSVDDLVAEGDKVGVRLTATGTHSGKFLGVEATGKEVIIPAIAIFRVAEGRITQTWHQVPLMGVARQIGALPATGKEVFGWDEPTEIGDAATGTPEENKALVVWTKSKFWNGWNFAAAAEIFAPECLWRQAGDVPAPPGPEGMQRGYAPFAAAFPDYYMCVDDLVAEGDRVATRGHISFTHLGSFLGVMPTGKKIQTEYIVIYRIAGGKVAQGWVALNGINISRTIGADLGPAVRQ